MDKTVRENIVSNLTNNELFHELVNLLKTNKNIIIKNIMNDKFFIIISIIKKIDYDINNIKNLSDDDIILINDLIKDKTNALTILLEIKKKKEEIHNYVKIITIIYNIILFVVIAIYIYLIYDLYFVNKTETNIEKYLFYLNILSYLLTFTYIISLKSSIIVIYNNIIAIKNAISNSVSVLPLFIYILIFKMILFYILKNHELIMKVSNDNGHIIIIGIILIIIAIGVYNIYSNYINQENPIVNVDLSVYILDKYGKKYFNLINNFIARNLYTEPIT